MVWAESELGFTITARQYAVGLLDSLGKNSRPETSRPHEDSSENRPE